MTLNFCNIIAIATKAVKVISSFKFLVSENEPGELSSNVMKEIADVLCPASTLIVVTAMLKNFATKAVDLIGPAKLGKFQLLSWIFFVMSSV